MCISRWLGRSAGRAYSRRTGSYRDRPIGVKGQRMRRSVIGILAMLVVAGCRQQVGGSFYHAGRSHAPISLVESHIELAAHSEDAVRSDPTTVPARAASRPSTQPARRTPYTAPSREMRGLSYATLVGVTAAVPSVIGRGKEASEGRLSAMQDSIRSRGVLPGTGVRQLGAPQTMTLNAVVGRRGLQRGFAAGLGFVSPNNFMTPRVNRMTGAGGGCSALVRAGLFPSQTACRQYFGK